jgi:CheY-like chemotaxis protein
VSTDVLIVDDDYAMRQILESVCELVEVPCRTARDGLEALSEVERAQPGMIILDLMMPRLDGYAVLERLRSSPSTSAIPVMIYTAQHLTAKDRARIALPDSMIIVKNEVTIDQLQEIISRYC